VAAAKATTTATASLSRDCKPCLPGEVDCPALLACLHDAVSGAAAADDDPDDALSVRQEQRQMTTLLAHSRRTAVQRAGVGKREQGINGEIHEEGRRQGGKSKHRT
jgi:hypothetical protein